MTETDPSKQKWPQRISLIQRSERTFSALLAGEIGNRFYQEKYLDGIAARRIELSTRLGKQSGALMLASMILAFFDLVSGDISFGGVNIKVTSDFLPIIAAYVSLSFLSMVMAFIDEQLIMRYINAMGSNIRIYNFNLVLLDKMAINLWADAQMPKAFGERSGGGHKFTTSVHILIASVSGLSIAAFPVFFVFKNVFETFSNANVRIATYFLSGFSCLIMLWSFSLVFIFLYRFKFYRPDFNETDLSPTPEFVEEMQGKVAKNE